MSTLVRNNKTGPVIFRSDDMKHALKWEGKGDPQGGDYQFVADTLLDDPQFLNVLTKGALARVSEADRDAFLESRAESAREKEESGFNFSVAHEAEGDLQQEGNTRVMGTVPVTMEARQGSANGRTFATISGEAEDLDKDGKTVSTQIPVIMDPLQRG